MKNLKYLLFFITLSFLLVGCTRGDGTSTYNPTNQSYDSVYNNADSDDNSGGESENEGMSSSY